MSQLHRHCSICCFYLLILLYILLISPSSFCANDDDDDYTRADFPTDFVFGAGTSAYQVEGAAFEDGRTPSIWDTFAHTSNFPRGNGDIACDHYHKYKEDVQLMAEIGLEAYRFSISWSRLIPNGRGPVNPKGLQFYNNLINELIEHGIQPHVTLHHTDAPQALEDEYAGWISRKIVKDFTAYADVCFKEFGDRILHWTTINEPTVFALGGYDYGFTPPGRCSLPFGFGACAKGNSTTEPYIAVHNMLLAHASVFRLYRKKYKAVQNGFVGTNIYSSWFFPSSNTTEDVIATQRAIDYYIGWFINPLVYGDYPNIVKKNAGTRIPAFTRYESKLVKGAFDFIGLNHYSSVFVKDNPSSLAKAIRDVEDDMAIILQYPTENTYPDQVFSPVALSALLEYIKLAYGNPPVYIHENGAPTQRNGTLMDVSRVKLVHAYIGNLLAAIRNGSNTKGYILWSFLDGYELLDGYKSAYGLYYVDLDDKQLRRYPKLSSYWYSSFLKSRSIRHDRLIEVNTEFVAKDG